MKKFQILKEPQIFKQAQTLNEPKILENHQFFKQIQIMNEPQILKDDQISNET